MTEHPFTDSPKRWILFATGGLAVAGIQAILLYGFAGAVWSAAMADAILSACLLAILAYLCWFIVRYVAIHRITFVAGVFFLLIWIAGCFIIQEIIMQLTGYPYAPFTSTLPLRLSFAIPTWITVMLAYRIREISNNEKKSVPGLKAPDTKYTFTTQPEEYIERISVKDGTRIHLINTNELLYIQACGDYVTLFTLEGQHVKEQTMKYFELHLSPENFIRIHRSTLVNVAQISRVELFGKENYQVLLKNGIKLRVSLSGYRLLKERLGL